MVDSIAILVDNISKRYRIGQGGQAPYQTLRESLVKTMQSPFRRLEGGRSERHMRTIWALKDVSFDVSLGQAVGIIGRNGAGKSTLLKILSRITPPTKGVVDLYGRVGSLLEVGTGFHPELTGRENIFLNGAILGMKRTEIERKFNEMVAFSEFEQFIDTPVKYYSSGMYMRLAFSVAAHLETEILLVDEILAVGDASFQKKCLGKMGEITRQGRTVLFVSHNMNAVDTLCTRCLLIDAGKLIEDSNNVRSVIHRYLLSDKYEGDRGSWQNDGSNFDNPYFRPMRIRVVNKNGEPVTSPVGNDVEMWMKIEGEIKILDSALTIGYAVYDEENRLLFWSYQTDQPEKIWPHLTIGRNILLGEIPARFFNEGVYRFELIGGLHFREWIFQPGSNLPSITLEIQGGLSDSPYWMMRRPGIMAPVLKWYKR